MTTATRPMWLQELGSRLQRVWEEMRRGDSAGSATLAAWRRGLSREPMAEPGMWQHLVPIVERAGDGSWARHVEAAAHHTLSLYALHQQSRQESMHAAGGASLGAACQQLAASREGGGVERRFTAAATADGVGELIWHLRGLVTLLRGAKIPLDYIQMARTIADWPYLDRRARHRRTWALDFYSHKRDAESEGAEES